MKDKRGYKNPYRKSHRASSPHSHPYNRSHTQRDAKKPITSTLCSICNTHTSKYKCPYCPTVLYCTLQCYKRHQELGCIRNESAKEAKNDNDNDTVTETQHTSTGVNEDVTKDVNVNGNFSEIGKNSSTPILHTSPTASASITSNTTPSQPSSTSALSPSTLPSTNSTLPLRDDVVTSEQLHRLATDDSMLTSLRNTELQHIIRTIDSARDRVGALEKYLRYNKDFQIFVDNMINTIADVEER